MLKATSIFSALVLALTSLSFTSIPARAGGEGVAAGIIGFAAGAIVGSQINKNRQKRVYRNSSRSSGRSAEERTYWKSIQAALNTVGYNAGPVDGAPGRKTRTAIKNFQLSLPAQPTGKLTPEQAQLLFARANPQPQPTYVATQPPVAYQQQPAQAFPNVTLPGNGTATPIQPATAPNGQQVTFPAPSISQDTPPMPAPAAVPAQNFPSVSTPTATAKAPSVSPESQAVNFPTANTDQKTATLPTPVSVPAFPSAAQPDGGTMVASTDPTAPSFPAVQDGAPVVTKQPIGVTAAAATEPVTNASAPATNVAPTPAAQAQVQIDASGQPFILVNGQKFLLQAAAPAAQ
ncbi:hypothetical protein DYI23_13830 [Roseibium polysiphoniae]|uniref:Peptidoglycan binding-like domain-containing protein n=1 Tax=Roseibium polysiphoniae TaxID=2571221 RepID=A0A944CDU6_9HYPH|nr:peptidoglycan-binding domain-containing protein [Roseibium polysiphoniae]MBS8261299.1 hypothetical protein [Roseibium polysiphoniae]